MAVSSKVDLTVSGVLRRYNKEGSTQFIPEYGRIEETTNPIDFGTVSFELATSGYTVRLPWRGYVDGTDIVEGGPYSSVSNGFNPDIYPPEYSHFIWNHPVAGYYRVSDYKNSNDFYKKNVLNTHYCPHCGHRIFPWNNTCTECEYKTRPGDEDKMAEPRDIEITNFQSIHDLKVDGDPVRYKNLPEYYTREERIFWTI